MIPYTCTMRLSNGEVAQTETLHKSPGYEYARFKLGDDYFGSLRVYYDEDQCIFRWSNTVKPEDGTRKSDGPIYFDSLRVCFESKKPVFTDVMRPGMSVTKNSYEIVDEPTCLVEGGSKSLRFYTGDFNGGFEEKTVGPFALHTEIFRAALGQDNAEWLEERIRNQLHNVLQELENGTGFYDMRNDEPDGAGVGGANISFTPKEEMIATGRSMQLAMLQAQRIEERMNVAVTDPIDGSICYANSFPFFQAYAGKSRNNHFWHKYARGHTEKPWNKGTWPKRVDYYGISLSAIKKMHPNMPDAEQRKLRKPEYSCYDDQHYSRCVRHLQALLWHYPVNHPVRRWALDALRAYVEHLRFEFRDETLDKWISEDKKKPHFLGRLGREHAWTGWAFAMLFAADAQGDLKSLIEKWAEFCDTTTLPNGVPMARLWKRSGFPGQYWDHDPWEARKPKLDGNGKPLAQQEDMVGQPAEKKPGKWYYGKKTPLQDRMGLSWQMDLVDVMKAALMCSGILSEERFDNLERQIVDCRNYLQSGFMQGTRDKHKQGPPDDISVDYDSLPENPGYDKVGISLVNGGASTALAWFYSKDDKHLEALYQLAGVKDKGFDTLREVILKETREGKSASMDMWGLALYQLKRKEVTDIIEGKPNMSDTVTVQIKPEDSVTMKVEGATPKESHGRVVPIKLAPGERKVIEFIGVEEDK